MIGVTIGDKHSWDDWKLVLTSVSVGLPEPKTTTVDVPGVDGLLDLTEVLSPKVAYENRTITLEFETAEKFTAKKWVDLLSQIANDIHGLKQEIILDEDPDWKYIGRCQINNFKSNRTKSQITISCDCNPYKYLISAPETTSL